MDKYTRRYLFDIHGHCTDSISIGQILSYMKEENADFVYLQCAIESEFGNDERQYLKGKLWDLQYSVN